MEGHIPKAGVRCSGLIEWYCVKPLQEESMVFTGMGKRIKFNRERIW